MPTTEAIHVEPAYMVGPMSKTNEDILIIIDGENIPHRHALEGEISLGRSQTNDIVLDDEAISRKHLRITRKNGKYVVIDLNSTNGVFIEDKRLHPSAEVEWVSKQILRAGPFYLSWQDHQVKQNGNGNGKSTKAKMETREPSKLNIPAPVIVEDVAQSSEQLIENPSIAEMEASELVGIENPSLADMEASPLADIENPSLADMEASPLADIENPSLADMEASPLADIENPSLADMEASPLADIENPSLADMEASPLADIENPSLADMEASELVDIENPSLADMEASPLADIENPSLADMEAAVQDIAIDELPDLESVEQPSMADLEAAIDSTPAPDVDFSGDTSASIEAESAPNLSADTRASISAEDASDLDAAQEIDLMAEGGEAQAELERILEETSWQPLEEPVTEIEAHTPAAAVESGIMAASEPIAEAAPELAAEPIAQPEQPAEKNYDATEFAFPDEELSREQMAVGREMDAQQQEVAQPIAERTEVAYIDRDELEAERAAVQSAAPAPAERTEVAYIDRDELAAERAAVQSAAPAPAERTEIAHLEPDDYNPTEFAQIDRDAIGVEADWSEDSYAEPTQVGMMPPAASAAPAQPFIAGTVESVLGVVPPILVLEPGQHAEIEVEVANPTDQLEEYAIHVEDLPRTWFKLSQSTVQLQPQERIKLALTVDVPDIGARAGSYQYSVYAEAKSDPLEIVRTGGQVEVKTHHDFEFNVARSTKRDGAIYYVSIHNKGNENDVYHVDRVDGDNTIDLQARNWDIALPPESKDSLRIVAVPVKRPLLGKTRHVPFELQVTSRSGYAQNHLDEVEVNPYLSLGMLVWLIIAVALGFTLVWTFLSYVTQSPVTPASAVSAEMVQLLIEIITTV